MVYLQCFGEKNKYTGKRRQHLNKKKPSKLHLTIFDRYKVIRWRIFSHFQIVYTKHTQQKTPSPKLYKKKPGNLRNLNPKTSTENLVPWAGCPPRYNHPETDTPALSHLVDGSVRFTVTHGGPDTGNPHRTFHWGPIQMTWTRRKELTWNKTNTCERIPHLLFFVLYIAMIL